MREKAQLWIGVSNREESMARVLSRAKLNEGTVLHSHRAAHSALVAVFEDRGWTRAPGGCADLCTALEARDLTPPQDVLRAARDLDAHLARLDPEASGQAPAALCAKDVATDCLDCVKRIRGFVNTVLSR